MSREAPANESCVRLVHPLANKWPDVIEFFPAYLLGFDAASYQYIGSTQLHTWNGSLIVYADIKICVST